MSIRCPLCEFSQTESLGKRSDFASIDMYEPYIVEMVVCFRPDERLQDLSIPWELTRSLRASHDNVEAEYLGCMAELQESLLQIRSFESKIASPLFLVKTLCQWFRRHGITGTLKGFASFLRDHYRGPSL